MTLRAGSTRLRATVLLCACAIRQVSAQQPVDTDPQRVEVKAAKAADAREVSISTATVITRAELAKNGDASIAEILGREPGITIVTGAGGAQVAIRGLGAGYTLVLIDGVPAPRGFSIDTLSPELVERIEISRSPGADQSGSAIAGTVNIILRKSTGNSTNKLTVGVRSSLAGVTPRVEVRLERKYEGLTLSGGMIAAKDRYRSELDSVLAQYGSGIDSDYSWQARELGTVSRSTLDLSPRVEWTASTADSVGADVFLRRVRVEEIDAEVVNALSGVAPMRAQTSMQKLIEPQSEIGKLVWSHTGDASSFSLTLGANRMATPSDVHSVSFDSTDQINLRRRVVSESIDTSRFLKLSVIRDFEEGYSLYFGGDIDNNQSAVARSLVDMAWPAFVSVEEADRYSGAILKRSGFVKLSREARDAFNFSVGARMQMTHIAAGGNGIPTSTQSSRLLLPSAELAWAVPGVTKQNVKLTVSRGFKPPTLEELVPRPYLSFNNSPLQPDSQGNPALKSESSWGADLSYERFFDDEGKLVVTGYTKLLRDAIVDSLQFINGAWVEVPQNASSAFASGVEAEFRIPIKSEEFAGAAFGSVVRNWSRVEGVPGPFNGLKEQAPYSAVVGGEARLSGTGLFLSASYTHAAGTWIRKSTALRDYLPPQSSGTITASWALSKQSTLRISLANLAARSQDRRRELVVEGGGATSVAREKSDPIVRFNFEVKL